MILERTPPKKWQQSASPSSAVRYDGVDHEQRALREIASAEKTFIFPSLEDMAAPVRQRQQNMSKVDTSRRTTPSVSPTVARRPVVAADSRASISPNTSAKLLRSPRKPSVSPHRLPLKKAVMGSATSSVSSAAVDRAFQEQMERAIASGENPFMDKRRAAMRDDAGNTSANASNEHINTTTKATTLAPSPQLVTRRTTDHAPLARRSYVASTSRSKLDDKEASSGDGHVPNRSEHDVQRASALVRRSLLGDKEGAARALEQVESPPPQSPPRRPPSPPVEVFTPQRKTISGQQAHIIPVAQQEEMHKLRAELRECKAQLRSAQLEAERSTNEAQELKVSLHGERSKCASLEDDVRRIRAQLVQLEVTSHATTYDAARTAVQDRMTYEEHKRQREIDAVLARNEITYLNARRIEAQEELEEAKGKQAYCGREWQEEVSTLQAEVERVRGEKKQLSVRVKAIEREREDWQEQLETLQQNVERESTRRREAAQREARLRDELEELQDIAARDKIVRKEVAELKAALAHEQALLAEEREKGKAMQKQLKIKSSLPPPVTTSVHPAAKSSSSPQRVQKSGAESERRQASRRAMQAEVESSFSDGESFDMQPASEAPRKPAKTSNATTARSKSGEKREENVDGATTAKTGAQTRTKADNVRPKARPVSKSTTAKKASRHADQESDEDLASKSPRSGKTIPASHAAQPAAVEEMEPDVEPEDVREIAQAPVSIVPPAKRTTTSVLGRNVTSKKTIASTSAPAQRSRRNQTSDEGRENVPTAKAVAKAPAYDETMKTPLLPTKRTRAIVNKRSSDAVANDDEVDDDEAAAEAEKAPRKSDITMATPMVRVDAAAAGKKKKRKLLKAGTNVAGDFLTWKGDADGALAPQLNLPMDLSPLKPGESDGATTTNKTRIGSGTTTAASSLFHRKG